MCVCVLEFALALVLECAFVWLFVLVVCCCVCCVRFVCVLGAPICVRLSLSLCVTVFVVDCVWLCV